MLKLHWSVLVVLILCVLGIIILLFGSLVFGKDVPEGGLALLSTIAVGLIGYEVGKR